MDAFLRRVVEQRQREQMAQHGSELPRCGHRAIAPVLELPRERDLEREQERQAKQEHQDAVVKAKELRDQVRHRRLVEKAEARRERERQREERRRISLADEVREEFSEASRGYSKPQPVTVLVPVSLQICASCGFGTHRRGGICSPCSLLPRSVLLARIQARNR